MNKVFFTDMYIHIALIVIIMFFTFISSIYILLDDNCNTLTRTISIIILIAVIFLGLKKETFLPFLGPAFIPNTLFMDEFYPDGANLSYNIDMSNYKDGVKVIYWASNSTGSLIENPQEAYKNFNNAGVTLVKDGKATIRIYCPDKYNVQKFMKKTLDKHFHYRVACNISGFVGPVQTSYVNC